jgi:uncharacterized protein (DUF2249 family)
MPTCYYCNIWYSDPRLDNLSEGEWMELLDERGDELLLKLDCGNRERHFEVVNETQKEILRVSIMKKEEQEEE